MDHWMRKRILEVPPDWRPERLGATPGVVDLCPQAWASAHRWPDLKKGDSMAFHFTSSGVDVLIHGQKLGSVGDKAFSYQLIRVWIGKNPPNASLKEGLLGAKK